MWKWFKWVLLAVLILAVIGGAMYFLFFKKGGSSSGTGSGGGNGGGSASGSGEDRGSNVNNTEISWQLNGDGSYQASGTAPACPSPLVLSAPTDLSKVVSVLYPGQIRGNDYKPHGGFRFPDGANDILVTAPMDATVIDGSRYLVGGEIQYSFDFENSCGIRYRIGHLRILSSTFATLAEQFPAPVEMDSRTTQINSGVKVKTGDTIATAVGLLGEGNAFFDFGVYDVRQANEASKDPTFQSTHQSDKSLTWYAICWFDWLSAADKATVKSLPATSPGSQSDYCK